MGAKGPTLTGRDRSNYSLGADELVEQQVEHGFQVRAGAGGEEYGHAALYSGDKGTGKHVGVEGLPGRAAELHRPYSRSQIVPPPQQQAPRDRLGGRVGTPQLGHEHSQGARLSLTPIAPEQSRFPPLPRLPRRQLGEVGLLVGQDAVSFELRHGQQQLTASIGKVVEELAFAGGGPQSDVVESDVADTGFANQLRSSLDDSQSSRRALDGEAGHRAANSTDERPPSTSRMAPWMSAASSLARKTAARATESGATSRPSGVVVIIGPATSAAGAD